ncbi:MAG: hypothetical protein ACI4VK_03550 [Candidatus Coproplasma sp.]
MTVKQFFKGKAFKCLIVLMCILLMSGAILTIAYGFLEVYAGERLQRAVNKIYPDQSVNIYGKDDKLIDSNEKNPESLVETTITLGDANVLSAYRITFTDKSDVHYLVQSQGMGGYSEGTVTCWVAINVDTSAQSIKNIAKVQIGESSGQTFMDKITTTMLDSFTKSLPEGGFDPSDGYISTGATKSSTAICNAVNGAVKYVNTVVFNNVDVNPYEELELIQYINVNKGKTEAKFAEGSTTDVEYTVITRGKEANPFTIRIVVDAEKKIKEYQIIINGSTEGEHGEDYSALMPASVKNGSLFVGKGLSFFTDIYGDNMTYKGVTGIDGDTVTTGASSTGFASNSTYLCMYAGAFATKNYDAVVEILNGGAANE